MITLLRLWVVFLSIFAILPVKGYVYAYARLYRPDTQTTIDLIYDVHMKEGITYKELKSTSYEEIKRRLYPSESQVLKALEHIHSSAPHTAGIIWESSLALPWKSSYFVNYSTPLIEKRFPKLFFSHADTSRRAFEKICRSEGRMWRNRPRHALRYSLREPYPLSRPMLRAISTNSGHQVMQHYKQLHNQTIGRLRQYSPALFCEKRGTYPDAFAAWSKLTDIEILSHILACPKKRIIVYAGGRHLRRISLFLQDKAHFKAVYEYNAGPMRTIGVEPEIPLAILKRLENYMPHPQPGGPVGGLLSGLGFGLPLVKTVPQAASRMRPGPFFFNPLVSPWHHHRTSLHYLAGIT